LGLYDIAYQRQFLNADFDGSVEKINVVPSTSVGIN